MIGIDEVGRGPLAGPLTLGAFAIPKNIKLGWKIKGLSFEIKDSKKLLVSQREEVIKILYKLQKEKKVLFHTHSVSNKTIDKKGLSFCIKLAIKKTLKKLKIKPTECTVLLDGGLRAPDEYKSQKTIIKGDEKKLAIALASIVAKVKRDNTMRILAIKYPNYGFEIHKGYGTASHYKAIKKHGISPIHRKSFLKNVT